MLFVFDFKMFMADRREHCSKRLVFSHAKNNNMITCIITSLPHNMYHPKVMLEYLYSVYFKILIEYIKKIIPFFNASLHVDGKINSLVA